MLGQPVSMLIPRVVGFKLSGEIPAGATATDVVLTITEMLRKHGVVGKFVEFYGEGVGAVPLANRATIGNMSPEFGSTCAIFPIDDVTCDYLRLTGRCDEQVALVEAYAKEQGLWHDPAAAEARYSEYLELDLSTVVPSHRRAEAAAGPDRAHRRQGGLPRGPRRLRPTAPTTTVDEALATASRPATRPPPRQHGRRRQRRPTRRRPLPGADGRPSRNGRGDAGRRHADRARPRRTWRSPRSPRCTNTSNPSVMVAAALLAKNAVERGPHRQAVGQDLAGARAPRSSSDYYDKAGLVPYLEKLGFHLVGYGCTTCIGNSGPLPEEVSAAVNENDLGRRLGAVRQPQLRGPDQPRREDELPGLAAAGHRLRPRRHDGLRLRRPTRSGQDESRQRRVPRGHLARRRPTSSAGGRGLDHHEMFTKDYADVFAGDERWRSLPTPEGDTFEWDAGLDVRAQAPVLRGHAARAGAGHRHHRRPRAGQARRLGHDRPHQPGRLDQGRQPGRHLPRRARRRPQGLQLLRLAPRQPRGDDPRHVRQHPAAQPAAGRRRGRLHPQLHRRRRAGRRSTTRAQPTPRRARRSSSWPARSTARGPRATGRPRAPRCSGSRRSSPSPTSGSTGRT